MRVVFRMSAIVAALAILAGGTLAGCGQRGALYLPTVPPLPPKPSEMTQPSPNDAASGAEATLGTVPDTSGTPLSLSTESELRTAPASDATASTPAAQPASGANAGTSNSQ